MLTLQRRRRRSVVTLALAGVALLSSGCASQSAAESLPDALSVAREPDPALASTTGPVDPLAPATYRPVVRGGKAPTPSVSAQAGRFSPTAPVAYPDGVKLAIDRVARTVERGEGSGFFPGRPQTAFTMTLRNDSRSPVDVSQVVVTTTYGVQPRLAQPVYANELASDFTGTVPPGGTATATYVFSLPPGQARSARMIVDMDAVHAPALFTGLED